MVSYGLSLLILFWLHIFTYLKMTLQQVCADVNRIKNLGQQLYIASRSKPQNGNEQAVSSEMLGGKLM